MYLLTINSNNILILHFIINLPINITVFIKTQTEIFLFRIDISSTYVVLKQDTDW